MDLDDTQPKPAVVTPPQAPVSISEDPRAKRNLLIIAAGIFGIIRALVAFKVFSIDLSTLEVGDIANILSVFLLAGGTAWLGLKGFLQRIKDGLNPHHSDPPIATPKAVVATENAARRLTGNGVPKP